MEPDVVGASSARLKVWVTGQGIEYDRVQTYTCSRCGR